MRAARALLLSQTGGVVLGATALLRRVLPPSELRCVVGPLCRLSRSHRPEVAYGALEAIHRLAAGVPALFAPSLADFFTAATDPPYLASLRLRILALLASLSTVGAISRELTAHMRSPSAHLARCAAEATAEVATRLPAVAEPCLASLAALLPCGEERTVGAAIDAIRRVLQTRGLPRQPRVARALALLLPQVALPHARASTVWCVGEYAEALPELAPETLRTLLAGFADEASPVKLQVLTLAAKCARHGLPRAHLMFKYALDLARYDLDCDVRGRARWLATIGLDAPPPPPTPTPTPTPAAL